MKIVTPKTADNCSATLTTRQCAAGWKNLIDLSHYPGGGVLEIKRVK